MSNLKGVGIAMIFMTSALHAAERPNVLFIAVDDLRPWLGCYDPALNVSPNIDRLAQGSRLFKRHYVQVPTCGASRCSLMYGRYPARLPDDMGNEAIAKSAVKQPHASLPALFRQNGYRTISVGKITHHPGGNGGRGWKNGPEELPGAWDVSIMPTGPWKVPEAAMHGYANGVPRKRGGGRSPVTEFAEGDDKTYPDGWITEEVISRLKNVSESGKPFFLAAGFIKPHLPFAAPARYRNGERSFTLPAPPEGKQPAYPTTWHPSLEFRSYGLDRGDPFKSAESAESYRRAYMACIRYTDTQIGKVLTVLAESPAARNTVVVLWGDHGWLHGEHGIWGKHCLFEEALHSPLIIRIPDQKHPGMKSNEIVESVDIYPTLAELAGIDLPSTLDGRSLGPQLVDAGALGDAAAFGAWQDKRTVRDDRYRLIVSVSDPHYAELYDHQRDPGELSNLALLQPEQAARLRELIPEHFKVQKH